MEAARSTETKARAKSIWEAATHVATEQPYLISKGINGHKVRLFNDEFMVAGMDCRGALVVPMQDAAGDGSQLQLINANGEKRYLPGPSRPVCTF